MKTLRLRHVANGSLLKSLINSIGNKNPWRNGPPNGKNVLIVLSKAFLM
ncbi:hypothetical protein HMPREF0758_2790 [Serratia odorifera DSM 4582]|uniref:Uncharacterized protein n=1 Tax=Serratia odorifera DSM 4582 TaxID=667129 RepID=D4E3P0_SEROD|nr:hypothetical protein HMPREF0758_2790 [Serratia odorifera DSM 4582]